MEVSMKVACTDTTAAAQVQMALESHGIINDVFRTGPHKDDPTIWIVVGAAIDSEQQAALQQQIERIPGATVHD
jgi:hypothetical protein